MQQGGLARAVWPDEPDNPSFWNRYGAVAQRPATAVLLSEATGLYHDAHAAPSAKQLRNAVR
jgi:hypothetical protein